MRGAGRDVEPKIEHDGIELEHLVKVAHEGAVYRHSSSCPVQRKVVDAVPAKDVTFMTWEKKSWYRSRTLRRANRARGAGARPRDW